MNTVDVISKALCDAHRPYLGSSPNPDLYRFMARAVIDALPQHTCPLPERLKDAADTIEELNALHGLGLGEYVSPGYLRHTAEAMERETPGGSV